MNEEQTKRAAQLRQAFEQGILDQDTYHSALAALTVPAPDPPVSAASRGVAVGRDVVQSTLLTGDENIAAGGHVVIAASGATVVIGEAPVTMTAVDRESALGRYLHHLISRNRYLQLQGIRSGGKLVHIELDHIYIRLRATQQRLVAAEERWLAAEATLAPGELQRLHHPGGERLSHLTTETVTVAVEEALAAHGRLVVLGDPGSGKTTLLRYLALLYARDLAEETAQVQAKLLAHEPRRLPILLPLRQVGSYLQHHAEAATEGHARLLEFLLLSLGEERLHLPADFFDTWLTSGNALLLFDGLDEVADPELRRRVARLVESFTRAYGDCRYVVTSRIVGYTGVARLGEEYVTTTVRDFTLADVTQFLSNWHRLVAIAQMGAGPSADAYAAGQTEQLRQAIATNPRIRDLAINPLMLTVIAMVHRDRVKLPDRRAELYAEAVDVLLGKWEEAKGVQEIAIVPGQPFDAGDRRLLLQSVALHLHEAQRKEIDLGDLRLLLETLFAEIVHEARQVPATVDRFLQVIEERTGLLVARGEGVYAFSHLTFQEYLAALAVAAQDDYITYSVQQSAAPWWREVILLEAGYLSTQSKERTTRLIRALAERVEEPAPYHNLVLAAECLRDVGSGRVQGNLEQEVQQRLRADIDVSLHDELHKFRSLPAWQRTWQRFVRGRPTDEKALMAHLLERKAIAAEALANAGAGHWTLPWGEPEWIKIPAGEFWMGGDGEYDGKPVHRVTLAAFHIARVPITNTQYHLFTRATDHPVPQHWEERRPPKGLASHPVVNVSWEDALAYCRWLSQVTGKPISLPSEAEWERAARGAQDQRAYPWGENFDLTKCNSAELGLSATTPVGIFPDGASPDGCLDMAGNVWEWTRSIYQGYPYNPQDGREKLDGRGSRVLRGGSFALNRHLVRCAARGRPDVGLRHRHYGFRLVWSPGG